MYASMTENLSNIRMKFRNRKVCEKQEADFLGPSFLRCSKHGPLPQDPIGKMIFILMRH